MAESKGYNLGTGFIHATISFDGIGKQIAQEMRKVTPKAGQEAGQRIGKGMREGVEKEAAKVDLSAYEAQVKNAEDRVAKTIASGAEKQAAARRKVAIAEAKLAETREKYKDDSSQVLAAEDRLADARKRLAREAYDAARAQDALNEELADARKNLGEARRAAEDTADAYKKSFGPKFVRRIHESLREAVSSQTAVVAAGANGALAGFTWGQGFKRALGGQNLTGFTGSMLANLSGARVLGDIGGGFRDFITGLDRSAPKVGALSAGLMVLSGAGIAAVGGILGVTNAIGSIAAAGLVLPGLLGGAAASVAVFSMAMADVTTVLADLGPAFLNLQDVVSANFWAEAAQPIRDLANAVLPLLVDRMGETATAMGSFFALAANEFNQPAIFALLTQMFDYLNESIRVAHDAVAPLTSAIMNLGTVGASYLPNLAGWFADISNSLNDWVLASIASGDIFDWIDNGLVNLKALGSVLVSTIGIFHALGTAAEAAGAGGLVGLAGGMERVLAALRSPEWQAGLTSMFSGASEAMSRVGDGFGNMARGLLDAGGVLREGMILSGDSVGMVLTAIGGLFSHPAVQGGLYQFFHGVHQGVSALGAATAPLSGIFGGLLGVMGNMASMLGSVVAQAVYSVGPAFSSVLAAVQPLIPILGTILFNAFDFLRPAIAAVGAVLTNVVVPAFRAVFGFVADNTHLILGLVTAFGAGVAVIAAFGAASWVASGGLTALIAAKLAAATATKAYTAAQWLLNTALTMNPIGLVIAALAALGVGLVLAWKHSETFRNVVTGAWEGIKSAAVAVGNWFTGTLVPGFQNGVASIGQGFVRLYNGAIQPVMGWIRGAVAAVSAWFTGTIVPNFHKSTAALGSFFDALYRNFIAPFVWAFEKVIGYARDWFSNTVVPAFRVAIMVLGAAFNRFLNATIRPVWTAVRTAINLVASWFNNTLLPFFRAAIARLGDAFRAFKTRTIDPVWNGIRSVINIVGTWFRNTLVPAFRAAVQSLQNKFTTFRATIVAVWDRIKSSARTAWEFVDRQVFQKFRDGLNVLETAFSMTRKGIADQWEKLREAVKKPIAFVVTKVINPFLNGYNTINNAWSGDDIDPIPGFRKGGYTGNKGKDEVAGLVHGREYVMPAEQTAQINRAAPGLLEGMRTHGASALPTFGHEGHAAHGGMAAGGPGGPGTYLWGGLQNSIYASGVAHVRGSAPGYDLRAAARAWNNIGNLKVNYGSGPNQINVGSGAPAGTWGYAWTNGQIQLNPNIPQGMKTGTAAHEIGHVLGLDHAGTNSIMHPMMRGPLWPSSFDRSTIQRIYGGSGKGNPPEGGGGGFFAWLSEKLSPLTKLVSGPLKAFKASAGGDLFAGMAGGIAQKVTDGLIDHAKKFLGVGDGGAGLVRPFADQKWDDPVGTVHKLSPGVSSIYNGTGGDEFFQRVGPGSNGGIHIEQLNALDTDDAIRKLHRHVKKQEAMYA